jgi:hypothetical protein
MGGLLAFIGTLAPVAPLLVVAGVLLALVAYENVAGPGRQRAPEA